MTMNNKSFEVSSIQFRIKNQELRIKKTFLYLDSWFVIPDSILPQFGFKIFLQLTNYFFNYLIDFFGL